MTRNTVVVLLAGVGMIVGSLGPWESVSVFVFHRDISGTALQDGWFTLAMGVVIVLCAFGSPWLAAGCALAGGGLAVYDVTILSPAWGLVLVVVSAVVCLIGAGLQIDQARDLREP